MDAVDVPVALLGYGTVGSAIHRLLIESADDIERATGHRLRIVQALVRDLEKERNFSPDGDILTTNFEDILLRGDVLAVAEVMGGLDPTGTYVIDLLKSGKHVVTANKQLVARRSNELFAAASVSGVQLRLEASVCAAIPVINVLRESLVVSHVHRLRGQVCAIPPTRLVARCDGGPHTCIGPNPCSYDGECGSVSRCTHVPTVQ